MRALHRKHISESPVILHANYTFLNYLVLLLGVLLLDDRFFAQVMPRRWTERLLPKATAEPVAESGPQGRLCYRVSAPIRSAR